MNPGTDMVYGMGNYFFDRNAAAESQQRQDLNSQHLNVLRRAERDEAALRGMDVNNLDPNALWAAGDRETAIKIVQKRIDDATNTLTSVGKLMSTVKDQDSYTKALDYIGKFVPGADKILPQVPREYDPQAVSMFVEHAKRAAASKPKLQLVTQADRSLKVVDVSRHEGEIVGSKPYDPDIQIVETDKGLVGVDRNAVAPNQVIGSKPKKEDVGASRLDWDKKRYTEEQKQKVSDRDDAIRVARDVVAAVPEKNRKAMMATDKDFAKSVALSRQALSTERGAPAQFTGSAVTGNKSFSTAAEANKAIREGKLRKGERITVGGRAAIVP